MRRGNAANPRNYAVKGLAAPRILPDTGTMRSRRSGAIPIMVLGAASVLAQTTQPKMMPYTAIDHPEFVTSSQATFLSGNDVLVGVSRGNVVKAYPAADLAQHGVVHDQMPDGPIAVTW